MLVVTRFRVEAGDAEQTAFRAELGSAVAVLAEQRGFEDARAGRNVDEPSLWVLVTRWRDVGSYRRALSSYDVKLGVVPLLSRALDEPSAYEQVALGEGPAQPPLNQSRPREG